MESTMHRLRVVALAGLVALLVGLPSGATAAAMGASVTTVSQQGDSVGGGTDYLFDAPGSVSLSGTPSYLSVSAAVYSGGSHSFLARFSAPSGQQLAPGEYSDTQSFSGPPPGSAGMDVSGDGRGCDQSSGRFVIKDIHADASGNVDRFWALYEQRCAIDDAGALYGEIRFGEPASTAPEQTEPTAIDWPSTRVGTIGEFVPITVVAGQNGAQVSSVTVVGPNARDFTLGSDGCSGESLNAGDRCEITVALAPQEEGDLHAQLEITDVLGAITTVPLTLLAQPQVFGISPADGGRPAARRSQSAAMR